MNSVKLLLISSILVINSCATIDSTDMTFHAFNALDAYQTSNYRSNCLQEVSWPTKNIIGEEPNRDKTALYFLGVSVAYQYVSERTNSKILKNTFTILKAGQIKRNQMLEELC